jgi:hypothetical protein
MLLSTFTVVATVVWVFLRNACKAHSFTEKKKTFMRYHHSRKVRFYVLDSIHAAAGADDGRLIARVVRYIFDTDRAVRFKALHFLAWASTDQLLASVFR